MLDDSQLSKLMKISGFDLPLGPDEFGYAFTGSNLGDKFISVKPIDTECLHISMPPITRHSLGNLIAKNIQYFDFSVDGSIILLDDKVIAEFFLDAVYAHMSKPHRTPHGCEEGAALPI